MVAFWGVLASEQKIFRGDSGFVHFERVGRSSLRAHVLLLNIGPTLMMKFGDSTRQCAQYSTLLLQLRDWATVSQKIDTGNPLTFNNACEPVTSYSVISLLPQSFARKARPQGLVRKYQTAAALTSC